MKHKVSFVFAYLWLLAMAAAGVLLLVTADRGEKMSETEQRYLQDMPSLNVEELLSGQFSTAYESFLSDRFFARDTVVALDAHILGLFSTGDEEANVQLNAAVDDALETQAEIEAEPDTEEPPLPAGTAPAATDTSEEESEESVADAADGNLYQYYYCCDGSVERISRYSLSQVYRAANVFNAYREALGEDGTVHVVLPPYAYHVTRFIQHPEIYCGWSSEVEPYLQTCVFEGVYIHNIYEILEPHALAGEYIFFRTDHHWTPLGAYYVHAAMMESQGVPAVGWDDYVFHAEEGFLGSYYTMSPNVSLFKQQDTVDVLDPLSPAVCDVITNLTDRVRVPVIDENARFYRRYLSGARDPWRILTSGSHTGRKALVIGDSFSYIFGPFLMPYYDEVHMVDPRKDYFTESLAGGTARDFIDYYGIDDIYFVLSIATGIATEQFTNTLPQMLGEEKEDSNRADNG